MTDRARALWTFAVTSVAVFMVSLDNLISDRTRLKAQLEAYSACDDAEIREVVRNGYGDLVTYVERVSGLPSDRVATFFAHGMLINVIAAMDLKAADEPWAERLLGALEK